jgi:hypothetical protein
LCGWLREAGLQVGVETNFHGLKISHERGALQTVRGIAKITRPFQTAQCFGGDDPKRNGWQIASRFP